jgi:hypothetical protein
MILTRTFRMPRKDEVMVHHKSNWDELKVLPPIAALMVNRWDCSEGGRQPKRLA